MEVCNVIAAASDEYLLINASPEEPERPDSMSLGHILIALDKNQKAQKSTFNLATCM